MAKTGAWVRLPHPTMCYLLDCIDDSRRLLHCLVEGASVGSAGNTRMRVVWAHFMGASFVFVPLARPNSGGRDSTNFPARVGLSVQPPLWFLAPGTRL